MSIKNWLGDAWRKLTATVRLGDAVAISVGGGKVSGSAAGAVGSTPPLTGGMEKLLVFGGIGLVVVLLLMLGR